MGERLSLDSPVSSAGKNLSVGQRQMIALARALVRRSRLLILDEGMSHVRREVREGRLITTLILKLRRQSVCDFTECCYRNDSPLEQITRQTQSSKLRYARSFRRIYQSSPWPTDSKR